MLREKLGVEFWKRLLSVQLPKIYYSTEALAEALLNGEIDVAGEFSIHIVYDYMLKKKTSIKLLIVTSKSPMPLTTNPTRSNRKKSIAS